MEKRYGKIKNGKLILAPSILSREGEIVVEDTKLYKESGYKELMYTTPPHNREGYDLISDWEEHGDSIIQKWEYKEIADDYSGELLVEVRNFIYRIQVLKREIKENYDSNKENKEKLLSRESLIRLIYESKKEEITTKELLQHLSAFELDLEDFFNWLQMKELLEERDYIFVERILFHIPKELKKYDIRRFIKTALKKDYSHECVKVLESIMISSCYVKSNLFNIYCYESNSTISNQVMFNMTYIYLFTLFDELLLNIIRIICMYEKKWLISNGNLSAEEIVKCDTTDELHMLLVEKKVNELAWGSYSDKLSFLKNRGVEIDNNHKKLFNETILYLAEKRNILVHNNGVWNQASKDILKVTEYYQDIKIGSSVDRSYECFEESCNYIESAIKYLYEQLCDKFNFLFKYNFPT